MDPLTPTPQLLCKLGSIIVHADEAMGNNGHQFDLAALKSLLADADVVNWLQQMDQMALIPKKRNNG